MSTTAEATAQATAAAGATTTGTDGTQAAATQTTQQTQTQGQATQTQQGTQTQTAEQKAEAEKAAAAQAAKPVVPEKYEVKLPDGMEIDAKALEHYTPIMKELGITAEGAQKLVDANLAFAQTMQKASEDAFVTQVEAWGKASREDKEFGGSAFDTNIVVAQRALAKFGSPQLKELFDQTGLGNHPEVLRAFVRIGKIIGEDGGVNGGDSGGDRKNIPIEQKFYGNQK